MPNLQLLELLNPTFTSHSGDYAKYSDKKLLCLAKYYGEETLKWRRRFIGLLPEVNHRKLYLKKGYSSIVEFGKRMAGLSEAQISLAINLEKKFEDKPTLHEALVKGKVSISKLVRVASIATVENEKLLAQSAEVLSKASLDVLVGDVRGGELRIENGYTEAKRRYLSEHDDICGGGSVVENGFPEPQNDPKSLPGHTTPERERRCLGEHDEKGMAMNRLIDVEDRITLNFQLDPEVIEKLNVLDKKGIDVNKVLKEILEKRDVRIEEQKEKTVKKVTDRERKRKEEGKKPVRKISVETKRILEEEYGTKCAVNGCDKEAEHLHHTVPFSINGSNSPDLLKPLCRAHHDIVHSVNATYLEKKGMG